MIVLLGATGYIGEAFSTELSRRSKEFIRVSRKQVDYGRFDVLRGFLRDKKPEFLINCAGYTGKPNVDACETAKADTLAGNTLLPHTIALACFEAGVPWGHVSSGCIYSGAKIETLIGSRIEKDMTTPELQKLMETNPGAIRGFTEEDAPNFTFRDPPCSFYSGTKALGEEAIFGIGQAYIWRLRIPFDEYDNPRNYLTKIQRYAKVYNNLNSISHRADYVKACLDTWEKRAPFGIYNITNPGFLSTRAVVHTLETILKPNRRFEFWKDDTEFYKVAAKTPRSNCVMDVSKLLNAGVQIRPVEKALEAALKSWRPATAGQTH
jgi:dTDP-4-dehydrorhamnose reductase